MRTKKSSKLFAITATCSSVRSVNAGSEFVRAAPLLLRLDRDRVDAEPHGLARDFAAVIDLRRPDGVDRQEAGATVGSAVEHDDVAAVDVGSLPTSEPLFNGRTTPSGSTYDRS